MLEDYLEISKGSIEISRYMQAQRARRSTEPSPFTP